jgi:hypothetical protein
MVAHRATGRESENFDAGDKEIRSCDDAMMETGDAASHAGQRRTQEASHD